MTTVYNPSHPLQKPTFMAENNKKSVEPSIQLTSKA